MVSKESVSEIFLPDEVYVVVGEKGTKQTSPRERGLKKWTRNLLSLTIASEIDRGEKIHK